MKTLILCADDKDNPNFCVFFLNNHKQLSKGFIINFRFLVKYFTSLSYGAWFDFIHDENCACTQGLISLSSYDICSHVSQLTQ